MSIYEHTHTPAHTYTGPAGPVRAWEWDPLGATSASRTWILVPKYLPLRKGSRVLRVKRTFSPPRVLSLPLLTVSPFLPSPTPSGTRTPTQQQSYYLFGLFVYPIPRTMPGTQQALNNCSTYWRVNKGMKTGQKGVTRRPGSPARGEPTEVCRTPGGPPWRQPETRNWVETLESSGRSAEAEGAPLSLGVVQFSSVWSFSHVRLFATPWTAARQASPSPTPGAHSNSCPSSQWCHPTISSSAIPFSHLQSFPASGSCPMSQLFASGGQSIGVSVSTSVLPTNIQDWFPLGWTGWISLQSKALSRVFSNTTVQKHQFFGT